HGVTPALLLSLATLVVGGLLSWAIHPVAGLTRALDVGGRIGPERAYDAVVAGTLAGSRLLVGAWQSGLLRRYVLITVGTAVAAVAAASCVRGVLPALASESIYVRPHEVAFGAITAAAAFVAITARSRPPAIAALGVVGYGVA